VEIVADQNISQQRFYVHLSVGEFSGGKPSKDPFSPCNGNAMSTEMNTSIMEPQRAL
jgi:hypothetical protein